MAASKQQHVSLESLKASTIQVTSTPSNYDELIERLMSFSQWYALTFGDKSSGAEGLVSLHSKLVLQKGLLRSRFEADPTYGAKICYAVDTRVNIHLKQCEVADEREDVDDSCRHLRHLSVQYPNQRVQHQSSNLLQILQGPQRRQQGLSSCCEDPPVTRRWRRRRRWRRWSETKENERTSTKRRSA